MKKIIKFVYFVFLTLKTMNKFINDMHIFFTNSFLYKLPSCELVTYSNKQFARYKPFSCSGFWQKSRIQLRSYESYRRGYVSKWLSFLITIIYV